MACATRHGRTAAWVTTLFSVGHKTGLRAEERKGETTLILSMLLTVFFILPFEFDFEVVVHVAVVVFD